MYLFKILVYFEQMLVFRVAYRVLSPKKHLTVFFFFFSDVVLLFILALPILLLHYVRFLLALLSDARTAAFARMRM